METYLLGLHRTVAGILLVGSWAVALLWFDKRELDVLWNSGHCTAVFGIYVMTIIYLIGVTVLITYPMAKTEIKIEKLFTKKGK